MYIVVLQDVDMRGVRTQAISGKDLTLYT